AGHGPGGGVMARRDRDAGVSTSFAVLAFTLLADKDLTGSDIRVLGALQKNGWNKGGGYFASVETLARDAGISETAAQDSLKHLTARGLIHDEPDRSKKTRRRIVRDWMNDPKLHPLPVRRPDPDASNPVGCENRTPEVGCGIRSQGRVRNPVPGV